MIKSRRKAIMARSRLKHRFNEETGVNIKTWETFVWVCYVRQNNKHVIKRHYQEKLSLKIQKHLQHVKENELSFHPHFIIKGF